ncbi:MAG: Gfo/Idh/MocA family oxidoreductase [Planctomycetota bacterium]|jgi:predicted dehydrogenase|nr:Gfo/Idh/MocA family oxidoreductase [Planctomycetota bacterium]
MAKRLNLGILGPGAIAAKMAATLAKMSSARLYAVASRDGERSRAFADGHGAEKAYASYEGLLDDPAVDLVYVATPNTFHHAHIRLCLEHGKPVLCEKPFTMTADEAEDAIALARRKGLFLAEAIWTRYLPFCRTVRELLDGGAVGRLAVLTGSLGNNVQTMPRIHDPALGGGALMDLGVYLLNFAAMFLGSDLEPIGAACVRHASGLDLQTSLTLANRDGRFAVLHAAVAADTGRQAMIAGERGYLLVENLINPQSARLFSTSRVPGRSFASPPQITGFEYEVEAAARALGAGEIECPEMPHGEIVRIMRQIDDFRARLEIPLP